MRRTIAVSVVAVLCAVSFPKATTGYSTDPKRVKQQIRAAWGGNDKRAIRVADCESSLNPKALSTHGTYRGLWQFSLATWNEYDPPADDPIKVNAKKQTEVAYRLFQDRGWQPWPTCGASKAADADMVGPRNTERRRR